jgi:hypothetical protein
MPVPLNLKQRDGRPWSSCFYDYATEKHTEFLFRVSGMILVLIFITAFSCLHAHPSSFLLPLLSHRYDINWILEIPLTRLFRFARLVLLTNMERNKKCLSCLLGCVSCSECQSAFV